MHKRSAKHRRALGTSIVGLSARDPPAIVPHPPPDSAPIARPLPSSEPSGATRSPTFPDSRLSSYSADNARSNSTAASASSTSVSRNPIGVGGQSIRVSAGTGSTTATSAVPRRSTPHLSPTSLPSSVGSSSAVSSSSADISRGPQSTSANAGAGACTSTSVVLDTCTSSMLVTGIPLPSQYSPGSAFIPASTTSSSSITTTSTAASSGRQLSGRTVADITIVSSFSLLALILVVVGRYLVARSAKRRRRSLGQRSSSTDLFLFKNESPRSSVVLGVEAPTSRQSSLSSFVAELNQELSNVNSSDVVPDLPPLAEVRERNPVVFSTGGTTVARESMNGVLSSGDNPDRWYPSVPGQDNLEPSTRTSVPPFSFSESFVFPRPPASLSFIADSFFYPGTQSVASPRPSATRVPLSVPPRAFMKDHPPPLVSTPSPYPQTSTPGARLSPPIVSASAPIPPLADLEEPGFSTVKVIHRSFRPSQIDELAVLPGDRIRLLRIFDDGWAFIEKLASPEGGRHEHGLIPVDCLREASQAFLTQQSVSIYRPG